MRKVTRNTYTINNVYRDYNGSFITYWKIYQNLLNKKRSTNIKINPFIWFFKSIWWLFIKPIGYIFHTKTTYVGQFTVENNTTILNGYTIKKTKYIYLLKFLPIFVYRPSMTVEDFKKLM